MDTEQWLGLGALAAIVAFVVFAFRQGQKVRPKRDGEPADVSAGLIGGNSPEPGGRSD
jgi:hypothetical protein